MKKLLFIYFILIPSVIHAAAIMNAIYDPTLRVLEREMRQSVKCQEIIAYNISNKDTDDFVPIRFADELEEIMSRPNFKKDKVREEEEMTKMTKNRYRYQALVRLMNLKFEVTRKVITQGR